MECVIGGEAGRDKAGQRSVNIYAASTAMFERKIAMCVFISVVLCLIVLPVMTGIVFVQEVKKIVGILVFYGVVIEMGKQPGQPDQLLSKCIVAYYLQQKKYSDQFFHRRKYTNNSCACQ